eukprot:2826989-Pleurochrysis_carterae.AAC.1
MRPCIKLSATGRTRRAMTILPPPAFGKNGMGKNRFKKLFSVQSKLQDVSDELQPAAALNPWRYSKEVEYIFNEHYPNVILQGRLLSAEEGMGTFKGGETRIKTEHPKTLINIFKAFLPSMPKKSDGEIKTISESDAGIIVFLALGRKLAPSTTTNWST